MSVDALVDDPTQANVDAHRVETARWVLANMEKGTPIYKTAERVVAAFLAGRSLPVGRRRGEPTEAEI